MASETVTSVTNRLRGVTDWVLLGIVLVASSILFPHVDELRDPGELCEAAYRVSAGGSWPPTLAHIAVGVFVLLSLGLYLGVGERRRDLALAVLSGLYVVTWSLGLYNWTVKTCFQPAPGSVLALGGFFLVVSATLGRIVPARLPTSE